MTAHSSIFAVPHRLQSRNGPRTRLTGRRVNSLPRKSLSLRSLTLQNMTDIFADVIAVRNESEEEEDDDDDVAR